MSVVGVTPFALGSKDNPPQATIEKNKNKKTIQSVELPPFTCLHKHKKKEKGEKVFWMSLWACRWAEWLDCEGGRGWG
jgi:hypothetical protein